MLKFLTYFLLNTLNHFWLVMLVALVFRKKKIAPYLVIYAILWLFIVSISPVPEWLTTRWESRYPVLEAVPDSLLKKESVHILILGGSHSSSPGLPVTTRLSPVTLGRLAEGIRLHRQVPDSRLVCSGYAGKNRLTQAEALAQAAVLLGVSPSDTLMVKTPVNTEAEAFAYQARFGNEHTLILVTSAIHMPRAMFWFQQAGLDPIPAPGSHLVKPNPERRSFPFTPSVSRIKMVDYWLHEWVGMWYGRWKA